MNCGSGGSGKGRNKGRDNDRDIDRSESEGKGRERGRNRGRAILTAAGRINSNVECWIHAETVSATDDVHHHRSSLSIINALLCSPLTHAIST